MFVDTFKLFSLGDTYYQCSFLSRIIILKDILQKMAFLRRPQQWGIKMKFFVHLPVLVVIIVIVFEIYGEIPEGRILTQGEIACFSVVFNVALNRYLYIWTLLLIEQPYKTRSHQD